MKLAFIVHNEHYTGRVMELLDHCQIDYYTRWEKAMGKGRQTEPHLGTGTFASLNGVFMIGFEDEAPAASAHRADSDRQRPDQASRRPHSSAAVAAGPHRLIRSIRTHRTAPSHPEESS